MFLRNRDSVKAKFARRGHENKPRTAIGHDVWIGRGAMIKAGANIGTGAVEGMGSLVTRDVPPYAAVGGNPAKVINTGFQLIRLTVY